MNYVFLYLVIMWSILECFLNIEYEAGLINTVFGIVTFRFLSWGAMLAMCLRYLGIGWGLLGILIIIFLFPDSFGFVTYFFIRDDYPRVEGFYALHFFIMAIVAIVSFFVTDYKCFLVFLQENNYIPLYILIACGLILYVWKMILRVKLTK